ncbi:cell division protein FtsB [Vibrio anguillarum]|jgi:cell division protein FtsB|uniref:Cell division protein FtsB n=2 Tax=Vibrio TaxID=662 RepID=A0A1V9JU24_VIBAN|nr:FtsB [Vibrio anguillarum 775]AGU58490.1 cell division protein FtsB [Vibrio anguillarum M3]ASF90968.1 cell division protein FtsB [Vibrio anguillarum]MDQ2190448.1 cell division protein FtsB [Vibrio sp. A14(2019)]MDQ2196073.1 cell division protein FtsB [Vibrio sp. 2017_1457_11]NAW97626.1 cell division protein FtsB [Vibrio sp. V23_P3S9T160]NAX18598.1 cell division protein FtsB [Vibrio sp. V22_P2S10T140]NCO45661.1 cell division protein FtsB [Vibrio sp.]NNN69695.1 cell division protein FtsB [V
MVIDVMRLFAVTLALLFGLLQYDLWLGKNGIADYRTIVDEIDVQQQVNENLTLRNSEMFVEIDDLRQGLDAIEERARHELGMIKEGETFYRLVGEDSQ